MDICGDERFEIIAKAKAHLLEATNIDMSPKEMEVLDNFLFRCWQMGWLDRYEVAEQTEPSTDCPQSNICKKPCKECSACKEECGMWKALNKPSTDCGWK